MRTIAAFIAVTGLLTFAAVRQAGAQVAGFPDVPKGHWAADSVSKLAVRGIIQGTSAAPLGTMMISAQTKPKAKAVYDGNKPVTRYELAVTLWRFVQYIDEANSQKRGTIKAMAAPADGPAAIKNLIAGGYLPKDSPLAKDGAKIVTGDQLADALAQVISRNREKMTPITPGSQLTLPIEKPVVGSHS